MTLFTHIVRLSRPAALALGAVVALVATASGARPASAAISDLSVSIGITAPGALGAGADIAYSVTVLNRGQDTIKNVEVVSYGSGRMLDVRAIDPRATCTITAYELRCTVAYLFAGERVTIDGLIGTRDGDTSLTLKAIVDPSNRVPEFDEANNYMALTVPLLPRLVGP